jgi:hypothetical protein
MIGPLSARFSQLSMYRYAQSTMGKIYVMFFRCHRLYHPENMATLPLWSKRPKIEPVIYVCSALFPKRNKKLRMSFLFCWLGLTQIKTCVIPTHV